MTIVNFSPYSAIIGGIIIGISASLFVFFLNRILGVAGIFRVAMDHNPFKKEHSWRISFLLGMIVVSVIYGLYFNHPEIPIKSSYFRLAVAGIFAGLGSFLGNGCTSGHGVNGLGRLSIRSFVAIACFMIVGFVISTFITFNF